MRLKHRIDKVENLLGGSGFQKMYADWIDLLELMYPNLNAEEIHSKAETLARSGFSVGGMRSTWHRTKRIRCRASTRQKPITVICRRANKEPDAGHRRSSSCNAVCRLLVSWFFTERASALRVPTSTASRRAQVRAV